MDLVGPGPLDPHFADADEAVRTLEARGSWLDVGSGAGFPGIALAAWYPDARVTLVERRQKRAAFLEVVLGEAHLKNAAVHCGDADGLTATSAAGTRGIAPGAASDAGWDGLISRAFRAPLEVVDLARGLLRPGGKLVLLLAKDQLAIPEGFAEDHVHSYLIEGKSRRAVVWVRV